MAQQSNTPSDGTHGSSFGLNHVRLIGRLTAKPELHYGSSGTGRARIGIAVSYRGEAEFFDVTVFGKTAEVLAQYGAKGRVVHIDGRLTHYSREIDGTTVKTLDLVADRVDFLDAPRGGAEDASVTA
jgi:single-strand DNA-binding protein